MVLMSFSDPAHITKLKKGSKTSTIRLIRKNPVKPGQTLQCYYRSRQKKTCGNCIDYDGCTKVNFVEGAGCEYHNNFFGEAGVIDVTPIKEALATMDKEELAKMDGFDSWEDMDQWFISNAGFGPYWDTQPYVVIQFEPDWLKGGDS